MRQQPRWMIFPILLAALMPIIMFCGGLFFVITAFPSQDSTDFYNNQALIDGNIASVQDRAEDGEDADGNKMTSYYYDATVNYTVNGKAFQFMTTLDYPKGVGDTQTIFYNAHNPAQASLSQPASPSDYLAVHLIFGIPLLLIGGVVTFVIFYFSFFRTKRQTQPMLDALRAKREGRPYPNPNDRTR